MSIAINYLSNDFPDKKINLIIEYAINQRIELYFLNQLTGVPQPLTMVQLMGLKKFGGINILLETGQTYQIGLILEPVKNGTYQEVRLADIFVNEDTLDQIKKEFG